MILLGVLQGIVVAVTLEILLFFETQLVASPARPVVWRASEDDTNEHQMVGTVFGTHRRQSGFQV